MKNRIKTLFVSLICFSMLAVYSLPVFASDNTVDANGQTTQVEQENQKQSTTEFTEQSTEESSNSNVPKTTSVDVTNPVLEKLELAENGQTMEGGSVITISADAYDADSSISYIKVFLNLEGNTVYGDELYLNLISGNHYQTTYQIPKVGFTKVQITSVSVCDTAGNVGITNFGNNEYVVNVTPKVIEMGTPEITRLEFNKNNEVVKQAEQVILKIYFDQVENIRSAYAIFEDENGNSLHFSSSGVIQNYVENSHYFSSDTFNAPGEYKYTLKSIEVEMIDYTIQTLSTDKFEPIEFTLVVDDIQKPVIQSIEMTHYQEVVKPKDTIEIKIKATDNNKLIDGYLLFERIDSDDSKSVNLNWNENEKAFVGTLEITEDFYPIEWRIEYISIEDEYGNYADFRLPFENGSMYYDYYFIVSIDGTFVNPTYNSVSLYFSNPYDYTQVIEPQVKENIQRRTTFKDAGFDLNISVESPIEGINFVGWYDNSLQKIITEDTEIAPIYNDRVDPCYNLMPVFEKNIIQLNLEYLNTAGQIVYKTIPVAIEGGMTYGQLKEYLNSGILNVPDIDSRINGWDISPSLYYNDADKVALNDCIPVESVIQDKVIVQMAFQYLNQDGLLDWIVDTSIADKDVTYDTLYEKAYEMTNQIGKPDNYYKDLVFDRWDLYNNNQNGKVNENVVIITGSAKNINHYVRYVIDPRFQTGGAGGVIGVTEDYEFSYVEVYDHGSVAKVPEKFGNYDKVLFYFGKGATWGLTEFPKDYEFDVMDDITWYGCSLDEKLTDKSNLIQLVEEANKIDKQMYTEKSWSTFEEAYNSANEVLKNENATQMEIDEAFERLSSSINSLETRGISLTEEKVEEVVEEIGKAEEGSTLNVPMNNATVVPEKVLDEVKGKDVNVTLDMGEYTWTINGNDVLGSELKDINLEVKFDTDAVPEKVVSEIAGDKPVKQLSLTYEGNFGFKGTLTFYIGKEYAGKKGMLYYYDSDGKMVLQNTDIIDENGYTSFTFSHASDYLVVIEDKETSIEPEEPDHSEESNSNESNTSQKHESGNKTIEKDKSTKKETTNTASLYNTLFYEGLLVISLMIGFALAVTQMKRKNY